MGATVASDKVSSLNVTRRSFRLNTPSHWQKLSGFRTSHAAPNFGIYANDNPHSRGVRIITFLASLAATLGLILLIVLVRPIVTTPKTGAATLTVVSTMPPSSDIPPPPPERVNQNTPERTIVEASATPKRSSATLPNRTATTSLVVDNDRAPAIAQEPVAEQQPSASIAANLDDGKVPPAVQKPMPASEQGKTATPSDVKERQGRYGGILSRHLADHKIYPRHLRDQGLQGRGVVRFKLNANGSIASLAIIQSTGVPELDALILKIVRRAAPFPVPEWARDLLSASFTMPVDFSIDE